MSLCQQTTHSDDLMRELDWNPITNAAAFARAAGSHWKAGSINWPMCLYLSLVHMAFGVGIATIASCKWQTLALAFVLWFISALGITGGAHRLWAHRSYRAHWTVRVFLMLCSSIANQGSIYHWARDHRVHHKHSETDADPHNASRGFFFAHVGWLLVKKHLEVVKAGRQLKFDDLEADSIVMFQHRSDPWLAFAMCFAFPGFVASLGWGESFWSGVWVAGTFRYVVCLHCTWLVNSAAHFFGDHPYDNKSWPAENPLVSVLSIGEGWHNWHHKYPFDYSASEFGISTQFNPTRLFIDSMAVAGLVTDRKRAVGAWEKAKKRRGHDQAPSLSSPRSANPSLEQEKGN